MKKLCLIGILLLCALTLSAQQIEDVLYLKNGTILRGLIIEQIPGKTLTIELENGEQHVLSFTEIERLARERKQPPEKKQPYPVMPKEVQQLNLLYHNKDGMDRFKEEIGKLDLKQREYLFTRMKKNPKLAVLNLLPWGIGSYVVGDPGMGVLLTFNSIFFTSYGFFGSLFSVINLTQDYEATGGNEKVGNALLISSLSTFGLSWIIYISGIIKASRFAKRFNRNLADTLNISLSQAKQEEKIAFRFDPVIHYLPKTRKLSSEVGKFSFGARFNLSF